VSDARLKGETARRQPSIGVLDIRFYLHRAALFVYFTRDALEAAHSLESTLNKLGGDPHFTFLPDRSHFNVYALRDDRWSLFDQIAAQLY
jgi:hypothetical protein